MSTAAGAPRIVRWATFPGGLEEPSRRATGSATTEAIQQHQPDLAAGQCRQLRDGFFLGMLIGLERQYRQRTAVLRTNVPAAIGAAAFEGPAIRINGQAGAVHLAAYVVTRVGFLGLWALMREEDNVRGLNAAARVCDLAAVGTFAGADRILEAALATLFVLAGSTLLPPLVDTIDG